MTERKIALSIEEAADYTGIGRNTLRKLVEWKKLPVLKVGRKVLIKTDILEKFIGNSVLVVSGYFKQDTTATAADKMLKVLEAEAATQKSAI